MAGFFGTIIAGLLVAVVMVAITDDQAFDAGVLAAAESAVEAVAGLVGGAVSGGDDGDAGGGAVAPVAIPVEGDVAEEATHPDAGVWPPVAADPSPTAGAASWTPDEEPPTPWAVTPVATP